MLTSWWLCPWVIETSQKLNKKLYQEYKGAYVEMAVFGGRGLQQRGGLFDDVFRYIKVRDEIY